jgi:hypothetical protein
MEKQQLNSNGDVPAVEQCHCTTQPSIEWLSCNRQPITGLQPMQASGDSCLKTGDTTIFKQTTEYQNKAV